MKRIIISGGGTGGHIYPAITIYRELKKLVDAEFLYVGTEAGLESSIVPKEGIPFTTLPVQGLQRSLSFDTLVTFGKTASSLWKAQGIIKKFKPDVVIGTGGYVCGPVLMAAALRGIPTIIQEQNVIPGITNKVLSRFVDVVAIGYEEARRYFKSSKRVVYTGNPVRAHILEVSRESGRKAFNLSEDDFMVLVAGGSRGARSINNAMLDVHNYFKDRTGLKIVHATGDAEYKRVIEALHLKEGETYSSTSHIVPYLHDMPVALGGADLAIFRAGAIGLAELSVRGIPSILIPYPYAAEDHQTYNAQAFVNAGAAHMIVDKLLTGKELIDEIEFFLTQKESLHRMKQGALSLGKPEAALDIAKLALEISR